MPACTATYAPLSGGPLQGIVELFALEGTIKRIVIADVSNAVAAIDQKFMLSSTTRPMS